jgi:acyl-CoA thioesterase-1
MKFVFFGDSICFGQRVSPHSIWVARISQDLHTLRGIAPVTVVNSSVNGNTTRMALERVANDLQNEQPDIAYIQFGLNDCNFWQSDAGHPRVSLRAFESNLLEIIDRAERFGAKRVLIGNNHLTEVDGCLEPKMASEARCTYREHIRIYNEATRRVAAQSGARLVDIETAWIAGPVAERRDVAMLDPDGLHLSPAGHDFYYEVVGPHCVAAVKELHDIAKGRALEPSQ